MNNKRNIEEDIKMIQEYIGLFYEFPNPTSVSIRDYEIQAIENIIADRKELQAKANAYDSLIQDIKDYLKKRKRRSKTLC